MDLVAHLDESRKPVREPATGKVEGEREHYIVAAAVVLRADGEAIRQHIASVERDLGFVLHYRHLRSRARKVAAVEAIVAMPDWDGYLFETSEPTDFRRHPDAFVRATICAVSIAASIRGSRTASGAWRRSSRNAEAPGRCHGVDPGLASGGYPRGLATGSPPR